jgi:hypothetical protein
MSTKVCAGDNHAAKLQDPTWVGTIFAPTNDVMSKLTSTTPKQAMQTVPPDF